MEIYAAGAAAAFTVDILVYPLDTLKTRYQSMDYIKADNATRPLALRGLYQGIGSVILATLPSAGIFFSTYESTKGLFSRTLPIPEPLVHSSASAVAELASCLVLAPAEVIKQNAQMLRHQDATGKGDATSRIQSSTSLRALRQLGSGGGPGTWRRLFTGYTALAARNLPTTAIQFPVFEHLRARMWAERGGEPKDPRDKDLLQTGYVSGVSAATAWAFAAWVTTPSDVVKTRMMLSAGDSGDGKKKQKLGARAVARKVYEEKGVRGFFRGGLFRSVWTALGIGLYLGTYDVAKVWLKRRKPDLDSDTRL